MRSGRTARRAVMAALAWTLFVTGCGINRRYANNEIRQLPHSEVNIAYAWQSASGDAVQQTSLPVDGGPGQRLTIVFPHPSPKYGRKYAEVTLHQVGDAPDNTASRAISQLVTNPFKQQEQESRNPGENDQLLRLTIPREELEFLLRDLIADSFFDREQRQGDVDLQVTLGSRTVRKTWDRVSTFDELARRVRQEHEKRPKLRQHVNPTGPAAAELLQPEIMHAVESDQ